MDTVVIGISVDNIDSQAAFVAKEQLTFPLLADSTKKVAQAFGVLSPRGYASRVTFVIDKEGKIRKIYRRVRPATHPDEVLAFIKKNLAK